MEYVGPYHDYLHAVDITLREASKNKKVKTLRVLGSCLGIFQFLESKVKTEVEDDELLLAYMRLVYLAASLGIDDNQHLSFEIEKAIKPHAFVFLLSSMINHLTHEKVVVMPERQTFSQFSYDPVSGEIWTDTQKVTLTVGHNRLFSILITKRNLPVFFRELSQTGKDDEEDIKWVRQHISALRTQLNPIERILPIRSIHHLGYALYVKE